MATDSIIQLDLFGNSSEKPRGCLIGGIPYISILDAYRIYGKSSNPTRDWKRDKAKLERQRNNDIHNLPICVDYVFAGEDGKNKKPTPIANEVQLLRIVQVVEFPEWDHLRQFMAELAGRELDERRNPEKAVLRRQSEIAKLKAAGYGEHPAAIHLEARNTNIENHKRLKGLIKQICDNPRYGEIFNTEYQALLGFVAKELEVMLETKSIRDALPTMQLQALTLAETALQKVLERYDSMSNEQILKAVSITITPIGEYLRTVSDAAGIHHVTGKPLLTS